MSNTFIWQRNTRNHTKTSCIKIIKLNRINNTREKINRPSCLPNFLLCVLPNLLCSKPPKSRLLMRMNDVGTAQRRLPSDVSHTRSKGGLFVCQHELNKALTIKNNFGYGIKEENFFSPLPIDEFQCPRMSVRVFNFSPSSTQVGGTKRGKRMRENGCKIRVSFALDVPNLCSPNSHSFSCLKVTLIRVNTRSPTIRSQKSNQNRKQINDYT